MTCYKVAPLALSKVLPKQTPLATELTELTALPPLEEIALVLRQEVMAAMNDMAFAKNTAARRGHLIRVARLFAHLTQHRR